MFAVVVLVGAASARGARPGGARRRRRRRRGARGARRFRAQRRDRARNTARARGAALASHQRQPRQQRQHSREHRHPPPPSAAAARRYPSPTRTTRRRRQGRLAIRNGLPTGRDNHELRLRLLDDRLRLAFILDDAGGARRHRARPLLTGPGGALGELRLAVNRRRVVRWQRNLRGGARRRVLPDDQRHELPVAYPLSCGRVLVKHASVPRGIVDLVGLDRGAKLALPQPLDRLRRRQIAQVLELDLPPV